MRRFITVVLSLVMFAGCAPMPHVTGVARASFSGERLVFALCESPERYEIGAITSNSAFDLDDVLAQVRADGHAYVYLSGARATPSAGGDRASEGNGVLLLGAIRSVPSRPDGC